MRLERTAETRGRSTAGR